MSWKGVAVAGWAVVACAVAAGREQPNHEPRTTSYDAVDFLAREVPRWKRENNCYSCHNNGDAARALIAAIRAGATMRAPLEDTLDWLSQPSSWDQNRGRSGGPPPEADR